MTEIAVQESLRILKVTYPETLGPFKRDASFGNSSCQAYVAHRFEKQEADNSAGSIWKLTPDIPGHGEAERNTFRYLAMPTGIVTAEQQAVWGDEDWDRHSAQRTAYEDALGAISRITTLAAVELFPQKTLFGESRMGRAISTKQVDPHTQVVILRISRGGDTPAGHAKRVLNKILRRQVQTLQATSQRKVGPHGTLVVDYTIKARTSLKDKYLFVPEQALATGGTLVEVLGKLFTVCESTPVHLVIGALNACSDGIRTVLEAFPMVQTTILTMALHNALTPKWYLDDPGMGDGGAEEALVED